MQASQEDLKNAQYFVDRMRLGEMIFSEFRKYIVEKYKVLIDEPLAADDLVPLSIYELMSTDINVQDLALITHIQQRTEQLGCSQGELGYSIANMLIAALAATHSKNRVSLPLPALTSENIKDYLKNKLGWSQNIQAPEQSISEITQDIFLSPVSPAKLEKNLLYSRFLEIAEGLHPQINSDSLTDKFDEIYADFLGEVNSQINTLLQEQPDNETLIQLIQLGQTILNNIMKSYAQYLNSELPSAEHFLIATACGTAIRNAQNDLDVTFIPKLNKLQQLFLDFKNQPLKAFKADLEEILKLSIDESQFYLFEDIAISLTEISAKINHRRDDDLSKIKFIDYLGNIVNDIVTLLKKSPLVAQDLLYFQQKQLRYYRLNENMQGLLQPLKIALDRFDATIMLTKLRHGDPSALGILNNKLYQQYQNSYAGKPRISVQDMYLIYQFLVTNVQPQDIQILHLSVASILPSMSDEEADFIRHLEHAMSTAYLLKQRDVIIPSSDSTPPNSHFEDNLHLIYDNMVALQQEIQAQKKNPTTYVNPYRKILLDPSSYTQKLAHALSQQTLLQEYQELLSNPESKLSSQRSNRLQHEMKQRTDEIKQIIQENPDKISTISINFSQALSQEIHRLKDEILLRQYLDNLEKSNGWLLGKKRLKVSELLNESIKHKVAEEQQGCFMPYLSQAFINAQRIEMETWPKTVLKTTRLEELKTQLQLNTINLDMSKIRQENYVVERVNHIHTQPFTDDTSVIESPQLDLLGKIWQHSIEPSISIHEAWQKYQRHMLDTATLDELTRLGLRPATSKIDSLSETDSLLASASTSTADVTIESLKEDQPLNFDDLMLVLELQYPIREYYKVLASTYPNDSKMPDAVRSRQKIIIEMINILESGRSPATQCEQLSTKYLELEKASGNIATELNKAELSWWQKLANVFLRFTKFNPYTSQAAQKLYLFKTDIARVKKPPKNNPSPPENSPSYSPKF